LQEGGESSNLIDRIQIKEYSKRYIEWLNLDEEERNKTIAPPMYEVEYIQNGRNSLVRDSIILPEKYNLNEHINIELRNQEDTETCWAFAVVSSLETHIAMVEGKYYDFSERHMDYATSRTFTDGINLLGYSRELRDGGNSYIAMGYVTRGAGPILEKDMPFENNEDRRPLSYIEDKEVSKRITDYVLFPNVLKDNNFNKDMTEYRKTIKEHIMKYGSITTGAVYSNLDYMDFNGTNFNIFCNNSDERPDHAVSIVGWDDNYAVENFKLGNRPKNPGAYIVRNSWGEDIQGTNYTGYDYISYEDAFVEYSLFGVTGIRDVDYDHIYQYDNLGTSEGIGIAGGDSIYAAKVFKKNSNGIEVLNQVGLNILWDGVKYEIYVNSQSGDLPTQNLKKLKEGDLNVGYNTIELDEPIYLTGDEFSIIVKYIYPGANEAYAPVQAKDNVFWNTASSKRGEGFIAYELNGSNGWMDAKDLEEIYKLYEMSPSIKAFTTEVSEEKLISLGNVIYNPNPIREGTGGSITIPVNVTGISNGETLNVAIRRDNTNVANIFSISGAVVNNNQANIVVGVSSSIPQGQYALEVGYNSVITQSISFLILEKADTGEGIEPEAIGNARITIKDSSGREIEGAIVRVYENNVRRGADLTTNSNGQVIIENVTKGKEYKIDVEKEGYTEQKGIRLNDITSSGQILEVTVNLQESNSNGGDDNNNGDNNNNNGGNNNNNNNNGNNNGGNNNGNNNDSLGSGEKEILPEKLPNTGERIVYIGAFIVLIPMATVSFIKMKGLVGM
jgi:C1A family cysteine protease